MNQSKIRFADVSFYYGTRTILDNINVDVAGHTITAIVGPSGHGKTTLLSVINRLWEEEGRGHIEGRVAIVFNGQVVDIYNGGYAVTQLRRNVGMVVQEPNPLPMSIYKNVAFPLKLHAKRDRKDVDARVRSVLRQAYLWDEVKDRLNADARTLSGGQQQRLCIARALMLEPEVLLLDEPTASLDPQAVEVIEQLICQLKSSCTILMVSHYMDQVHRIADRIMSLTNGQLTDLRHSVD